MARTNTVSVFVQMTAVTANGVADRPEDCVHQLCCAKPTVLISSLCVSTSVQKPKNRQSEIDASWQECVSENSRSGNIW